MIGCLDETVIDCPGPQALAAFYAEVLGVQRASTWVAPAWPDPTRRQHVHLDIRVGDVRALRVPSLPWALDACLLHETRASGPLSIRSHTRPAWCSVAPRTAAATVATRSMLRRDW